MNNNNTEVNSGQIEDHENLDELARSNVTHANIYRNLLNHERDEEERRELRIDYEKQL